MRHRASPSRNGRPSISISAMSDFESFLLFVRLVATIWTRSTSTSTLGVL
jgi:hypothetical protein